MKTIKLPLPYKLQANFKRVARTALAFALMAGSMTISAPAQTTGRSLLSSGHSATSLVPLVSGDILIADSYAAILKCDPHSGESMVVASGWPLVQPFGITLDAAGQILVTDTGVRAVFRINPATGTTELVATNVPGLPFGLAANRRGDIFVANSEAVLRIENDTRVVSVLATGGFLKVPLGVAVGADGNLFVADASGSVVKVDANDGTQTLITERQLLRQPVGIALEANDNVLITDSGAQCLIHVNSRTGAQRIVSEAGYLTTPVGVAVEKTGSILVSDPDAFSLDGGITRVAPANGSQSPLMRGQANYVNPRGIVIVLPSQANHPN